MDEQGVLEVLLTGRGRGAAAFRGPLGTPRLLPEYSADSGVGVLFLAGSGVQGRQDGRTSGTLGWTT